MPRAHASTLTGAFNHPFAEQIAFFSGKLGNLVPTKAWDDIQKSAHDRAFMVAGATKADLLSDLASTVDKSIKQGTSIQTFRKDFFAAVEKHGWRGWRGDTSDKGRAWRTRIIYVTNARTSYNAGRYAQLQSFDYWIYRHNDSVKAPRLQHLSWDGLVLPKTHVFWSTHAPQNGWGCRCYVLGTNKPDGATRLGGDPNKQLPDDWNAINPKTGAPVGIDKGWDYQPGQSVTDTVNVVADKIKQYPALIGAAFGATLSSYFKDEYLKWLTKIQASDKHGQKHAFLGVLHKDDILALAALNAAPKTAEVMIKPGIVVGPKADRHEARGDAITQEQWEQLPNLWQSPSAVLFDVKSQKLIYLLQPSDTRVPQLAISLDYYIKKKNLTNEITSAYRPRIETIKDRITRGDLKLLRGKVE